MIHPTVNPYALTVARTYRGYSKNLLSKAIKGLSQYRLSKFENGSLGSLSIDELKQIMEYLEFPFEFLYKDIKPIKTTYAF
jgi:transcriptional regulator with XRE-family HTH domain